MTFRNESNIILKIYVEDVYIAKINPSTEVKEKTVPAIFSDYEITIFNEKGDKVYSKIYLYNDLEETNFRIVIKQEDLLIK